LSGDPSEHLQPFPDPISDRPDPKKELTDGIADA
jgi:hypothetical protein